MGFRSLGFSGHGYVPFEGLYCGMTPEGAVQYRGDIKRAKEACNDGRFNVYAGIENDSANLLPLDGYDYSIGSVHCIKCGDKYYSIDSSAAVVASAVADEFNGDGLAYAKAYFCALNEFVSEKRADILGHLDIVRRFNKIDKDSEAFVFFDEQNADYRRAAVNALELAVRSGYIIEVNTAPILKGFSNEPYPAFFLLEAARELGARVIVSSDAHYAANLNYAFERVEAVLRRMGFRERWELAPDGFQPVRV